MPKLIGKIEFTLVLKQDGSVPPDDDTKEKLETLSRELVDMLEARGYDVAQCEMSMGLGISEDEMEQLKRKLFEDFQKHIGHSNNDVTYTPDGIPVPHLGRDRKKFTN